MYFLVLPYCIPKISLETYQNLNLLLSVNTMFSNTLSRLEICLSSKV